MKPYESKKINGQYQGKSGTPVQLSTNFFRADLDIMKSKTDYIYQYRVDFTPISDSVQLKEDMIEYVLTDERTGHTKTHLFEGNIHKYDHRIIYVSMLRDQIFEFE